MRIFAPLKSSDSTMVVGLGKPHSTMGRMEGVNVHIGEKVDLSWRLLPLDHLLGSLYLAPISRQLLLTNHVYKRRHFVIQHSQTHSFALSDLRTTSRKKEKNHTDTQAHTLAPIIHIRQHRHFLIWRFIFVSSLYMQENQGRTYYLGITATGCKEFVLQRLG